MAPHSTFRVRALASMKNPPTGIIRTLPSLYTDPTNPGWRGLRRSIAACERDDSAYFYIALAQQPKFDVLHLYLLVGNEITMRFNLAGYAPGHEAKCWDGTIRQEDLMPGRETWTKHEEDQRRHELYTQALGEEKSLTEFDNDDFDKVKARCSRSSSPAT
jgi:hypothetical protein